MNRRDLLKKSAAIAAVSAVAGPRNIMDLPDSVLDIDKVETGSLMGHICIHTHVLDKNGKFIPRVKRINLETFEGEQCISGTTTLVPIQADRVIATIPRGAPWEEDALQYLNNFPRVSISNKEFIRLRPNDDSIG